MAIRARQSGERGAATTEFALAMLLIVPTVIYMIYVGEIFLAGIKAQEAEINAGWDVTGYRLHDFRSGATSDDEYNQAVSRTQGRVSGELSDLDSAGGSGGSGRNLALSHQTLSLGCSREAAPGAMRTFNTFANMPQTGNGATNDVQQLLPASDLVRCKAAVRFENRAAPVHFLQELSRVDMLKPSIVDFNICGLGETIQACDPTRDHGFAVLPDDWGLENGQSVDPTVTGSASNPGYYTVGEALYNYHGTPLSRQQIKEATQFFLDEQTDPGQTHRFRMGYQADVAADDMVDTRVGPQATHLSPWNDVDPSGAISTSREVYNNNRGHNYLGHPDPNYNDP